MNANLTCPHCNFVQSVVMPQAGCLVFHKCKKCKELISVPKGSKNCCVVCEYADRKCPVPNN